MKVSSSIVQNGNRLYLALFAVVGMTTVVQKSDARLQLYRNDQSDSFSRRQAIALRTSHRDLNKADGDNGAGAAGNAAFRELFYGFGSSMSMSLTPPPTTPEPTPIATTIPSTFEPTPRATASTTTTTSSSTTSGPTLSATTVPMTMEPTPSASTVPLTPEPTSSATTALTTSEPTPSATTIAPTPENTSDTCACVIDSPATDSATIEVINIYFYDQDPNIKVCVEIDPESIDPSQKEDLQGVAFNLVNPLESWYIEDVENVAGKTSSGSLPSVPIPGFAEVDPANVCDKRLCNSRTPFSTSGGTTQAPYDAGVEFTARGSNDGSAHKSCFVVKDNSGGVISLSAFEGVSWWIRIQSTDGGEGSSKMAGQCPCTEFTPVSGINVDKNGSASGGGSAIVLPDGAAAGIALAGIAVVFVLAVFAYRKMRLGSSGDSESLSSSDEDST